MHFALFYLKIFSIMIKRDETLPYPYIPGYTGTYEDRQKAFKSRLKVLLEDLMCLENKYKQNKNDTSLLADLEKCQEVVRGMNVL